MDPMRAIRMTPTLFASVSDSDEDVNPLSPPLLGSILLLVEEEEGLITLEMTGNENRGSARNSAPVGIENK